VALRFGPEDKGLANAEIEQCSEVVSVPTAPGAWSLNLSHAVLILLYECFTFKPSGLKRKLPVDTDDLTTQAELHLLFKTMQQALQAIDFLPEQNTDYFMMPLRRFFGRMHLRRYESNLLMGICRQVQWIAGQSSSSFFKPGQEK